MNYEITEQQIKELSKENAKVKKWFPEVFEINTINKWVIVEDKNFSYDALVYDNGEQYTYGFNHANEWTERFNIGNINEYFKHQKRLATDSEVLEALTNEAKKRELFRNTYIKSIFSGGILKTFNDSNYYIDEQDDLRLGSVVIFHRGKWATPIKTYTKEEAEKLLNAKII